MNNPKRIAFFFATPNTSFFPNFLTLPYVFNIVKLLDQAGIKVDLFLNENHDKKYSDYFSSNVNIKFLDYPYLRYFPSQFRYKSIISHFRTRYLLNISKRYDLVFGSGLMGSVLGFLTAKGNNAPFIYVNDEFPDSHHIDFWKILEKEYAKNASLIIVPDECRIEPLQKQIPGIKNIPFAVLPNAPLLEPHENLPEINWHERLNIPKGKKIFLFSGTIHRAVQSTEIICTVPLWPQEAVLVLKIKSGNTSIIREYNHLRHMNVENKIFWASEFMTPLEINSLCKYSDASFGLYREVDDNLKFIGKSSGKILNSLAYGTPVIGNIGRSMDFIEKYNLGALVSHPLEIPEAVKYVITNSENLRENCRKNYMEISFEKYWKEFPDKLLNATNFSII